MDKKIGDLYWSQLSMWDFSKKENIDIYNKKGFHYELHLITDIVNKNHYKFRRVKTNELSSDEIDALIPPKGIYFDSVVGNNKDLLLNN